MSQNTKRTNLKCPKKQQKNPKCPTKQQMSPKCFSLRSKLSRILKMKCPENSNKLQYFVWMDDDIFLTNFQIRLETFWQLVDDDIHLILSRDCNRFDPFMLINAAIFLVKNSDRSREFFRHVFRLYFEFPKFQKELFHEQSIITLAYYQIFQNETVVLPLCLLQSFWSGANFKQWRPGHFGLHAVDMKNSDRLELFRKLSSSPKFSFELAPQANRDCSNDEFLTFY